MPAPAQSRALADALAAVPTTVPEVARALRAIESALPPADGVACFTRLYRAVTEAVDDALTHRTGTFANPAFVARLDVVFAELYLEALRGSLADPPAVPPAWAPLVRGRERTDVSAIQFALAGMNAHVNRDLPVALVRTFEETGVRPTSRPEHEDYVRVNVLLVETEARVKAEFSRGVVGFVDRKLGDLDDVVAMWNVARARDAAWTNGETLWHLRDAPELAAAFVLTLDRTVGFAGRGLLRPARPAVTRVAQGALARLARAFRLRR